jgi:hypothetical protein
MSIFSSAIFSGVVLAKPVMEARAIYENRGRALASIGCAVAAFSFFMTALVVATMDIVLQLDSQGFVMWSALLTAAVTFVVFAALLGLAAIAVFPKPAPSLNIPVHEMAQLALQKLAEHLPHSQTAAKEMVREENEVEIEREKISTRARGDLDLDQMPTPAFTH